MLETVWDLEIKMLIPFDELVTLETNIYRIQVSKKLQTICIYKLTFPNCTMIYVKGCVRGKCIRQSQFTMLTIHIRISSL